MNRPDMKWLSSLLRRHDNLTLKRLDNIESDRHESMNPENVRKHFARLSALMKVYDIYDPIRIFDLDDSDFLMTGTSLVRTKCVAKAGEHWSSREIRFRGSCNLVKLMSVVSAGD